MTHIIEIQIFEFAERVIRKIGERYGDGRMGGSLCLYNKEGQLARQQMIGEPALKKSRKYESFAREKSERLSENPEHISSWESRDPDNQKYGGAIRLPSGMIISFSGMPEAVDTAFCLLLMYAFDIASEEDLVEISERAECKELFFTLCVWLTPKSAPGS